MHTPRPATAPQPVSEQELEEVLRSLEVELWSPRPEGPECNEPDRQGSRTSMIHG
jgi:hypothetical protein